MVLSKFLNYKSVLTGMFIIFCLSFFTFIIFYIYIALTVPDVNSILKIDVPVSTIIKDRDNLHLGEIYKEKRYWVDFSDIPPLIVKAFISAEDAKFYEHKGFDFSAIWRALRINIERGKISQGGSTISQQLAKSLLSREKTFFRKAKEAFMTYRIERHLPKNRILELYINMIYFGRGCYGVKAASLGYFGKPLSELNTSDITLLVALVQAPSFYSNNLDHPNILKRRHYILSRLLSEHYITEDDAKLSILDNSQVIKYSTDQFIPQVHSFLIDKIRKEYRFLKSYDLESSDDNVIETSISKKLLEFIEKNTQDYITKFQLKNSKHHVLVSNLSDSKILAYYEIGTDLVKESDTNKISTSPITLTSTDISQRLILQFAQIIFLLQNEKGIYKQITPIPSKITSDFSLNVMMFQTLNQILPVQIYPLQSKIKNITPEGFSNILKNYLDWDLSPINERHSYASILLPLTELFLGIWNKKSNSLSLVSQIIHDNQDSENIVNIESPIPNQINCSNNYLGLLNDWFLFNTSTRLSKIPNNFHQLTPTLYILPIEDDLFSLIVFRGEQSVITWLTISTQPILPEHNTSVLSLISKINSEIDNNSNNFIDKR